MRTALPNTGYDFSIIGDLTDQDLEEELGVVHLGDRRRLLRAIAKLAGAASATPQLAPTVRIEVRGTKPSAAKSR